MRKEGGEIADIHNYVSFEHAKTQHSVCLLKSCLAVICIGADDAHIQKMQAGGGYTEGGG